MSNFHIDLSGKTAIVTGSASGIGRAIATYYARSGANVVIDYVGSQDAAAAVLADVDAFHGSAMPIEADISKELEADALIAQTVKRFGGVDILVNNAGIEMNQPVVQTSLDSWQRVLDVNLTGTFLCSRATARAMIAAGKGGRIINVSSVHEELAFPGYASYAASKGGIRMFMRTLALELAQYDITVNDIAPGAIATAINEQARTSGRDIEQLLAEIPLRRIGTTDDVAQLAGFLASDGAGYVTGATYRVDGGLSIYAKGL